MNVNKSGIRVVQQGKSATINRKRQPLEYALDTMTFWRKEAGEVITCVIPRFSHLREALKEDGWRVLR